MRICEFSLCCLLGDGKEHFKDGNESGCELRRDMRFLNTFSSSGLVVSIAVEPECTLTIIPPSSIHYFLRRRACMQIRLGLHRSTTLDRRYNVFGAVT